MHILVYLYTKCCMRSEVTRYIDKKYYLNNNYIFLNLYNSLKFCFIIYYRHLKKYYELYAVWILLCIRNVDRVLSLSLRHQSAASSRAAVLAIRSITILVCDVTIVSCVAEAQRSNCFTVTVCVFAIICVSGVDRWHLYKFFPRKICEKERNFVTASR